MSKSYKGRRLGTQCQVWVLDHTGGHVLDQHPSLGIRVYNPVKFDWGHESPATAQLALALLLEHTKDPNKAEAHHQEFKEKLVMDFHRDKFELHGREIDAWLAQREVMV